MTARDFCFWLQGYFELTQGLPSREGQPWIDTNQAFVIRKHLDLVFKHEIDPSMGPQKHQDTLNQIHDPIPTDKYNPDKTVRC